MYKMTLVDLFFTLDPPSAAKHRCNRAWCRAGYICTSTSEELTVRTPICAPSRIHPLLPRVSCKKKADQRQRKKGYVRPKIIRYLGAGGGTVC